MLHSNAFTENVCLNLINWLKLSSNNIDNVYDFVLIIVFIEYKFIDDCV